METPKIMTRTDFQDAAYAEHPNWQKDREAFWNYHKRLLCVSVPKETVLKLFSGDWMIKWSDDKWTLFDAVWDFETHAWKFSLHHPDLPYVPEGHLITRGHLMEISSNGKMKTFAVVIDLWGT